MRRLGAAANGLLALAVALVPSLGFVLWAWPLALAHLDKQLIRSQPLLEQEASVALQRPVHFGKLSPNLSLATLQSALSQSSLPVIVENLELGTRPEELRWSGQDWLVRIPQLQVQLSLVALRESRLNESGVGEVVVERPEILLYRTPEGKLSVEDFLPKPTAPSDPLQPPFQTIVRVRGARVHVRDFASLRAPGRAEENHFERFDATADLLGTRTLRFIARGFPAGNTTTRLSGPIQLEGTARRDTPSSRTDSPSAQQPLLSLSATVRNADLPYWISYALPQRPEATLTRGRTDARIALLLPAEKDARPEIRAEVHFTNVDVAVTSPTKLTLSELGGTATYADDVVTTAVAGKALDARFLMTGRLSSLTSPDPLIAATLTMPQVPLRRALVLLPSLTLPKELVLSPTAKLEGATLTGSLKALQASARVSGLKGQWKGLPQVDAQANLTYANGIVEATAITATLEGGGSLTAQGRYTLKQQSGTFEAHLRNAELSRVTMLTSLQTPPTGKLDADFTGQIVKNRFTAEGLAKAQHLRIAGLEFPSASAQLALKDTNFQVLDGALAGPGGALRLSGNGTIGGEVALEGHLVGANLTPLADAFGLPGVEGTISASAQLTSKATQTLVLLRDVTVLQPRYHFENYLLIADAAHIERASLRLLPTGQVRVELDPMQPLRLTRSPAIADISGTITGTKDSAQLNLSARAENIELDTLLSQLSEQPGTFAPEWLQKSTHYQSFLKSMDWTGVPKPPVSGFIRQVQATITGDAKGPQIDGDATLGRFLVADYPLEGGTFSFTRDSKALRVDKILLTSATGAITGQVQLAAQGELSGSLQADKLDMEVISSLSGLVEQRLGVTGMLSALVTIAGTQQRPILTAKLTEIKPIAVVGIPIQNLEIGELRFAPELDEDSPLLGEITLPRIALQLGDTGAELAATSVRYDLATNQLSGDFGLTEARLQKVVTLLQGAHLDDTPEGRDFLRSLYELPTFIDATLALTGSASARFTPDGPRNRRATLRLSSPAVAIQTGSKDEVVQGPLAVRATLLEERLNLDSASLTLANARTEEPTILRLLPHPGKDPETSEPITTKSWLRLPYSKEEPLEYHLTLDSNSIPLELVRTLAPGMLPTKVQGNAAVTVAADGTTETPHVVASFFANNLLVGDNIGQTGQFNAPPLLVDLLRFQVELVGKTKQDWSISVSDGRLTHAKEILTFEGQIPYDKENLRIAANRPISLSAVIDDAAGLTVATLSEYFNTAGTQLTGTIRGNISLKGSLNTPELDGRLSLTQASARFPSPGQRGGREVINPIQNLEIALEFTGKEVRFPKAELTLAHPAPGIKQERGKPTPALVALAALPSAGKLLLEPGSVIRIENLEDFTRLFVRRDSTEIQPKLRGEFDLKGRFEKFQLDTDNASVALMNETLTKTIGGGLEEALKGQIDGQFSIKGPLLTPLIATAPNENLLLSGLSFRIPKRQLPESSQNNAIFFNPRFAITLETSDDARLINPDRLTGFEFRGNGGVSISGDLAAPKIEGTLIPTGGYYQYPLSSPFTVQRGGEILMTYAKHNEAGQDSLQLDLKMQDVVAEGKVLVSASAARSAQSSPAVFDPNRASNQIPDELIGKRITITARFNGLVRMGDPTRDSRSSQPSPIKLTSDANLSEFALLSLLVPYQMLSQFVGSNSQQAIRDIGSMLQGSLTGSLITPVTDQISRLFGLDNFSVDYNLGGLSNFYLFRRLPEPFDKVTLEVRRSFQTRSGTGQLLPQLYSLSYEIGQLRKGSRLLIGGSTNEQRDNQLFLRGTLRY